MKQLYESILSSTNAGKYAVVPRFANEDIFLLDFLDANNLLENHKISYDRDKNLLTFDSIRHTALHVIGTIPKGLTIDVGENWVLFDGVEGLDECTIQCEKGINNKACIAVINSHFKDFSWCKYAPYVMIVHNCNVQSSKGFKCLRYACTGDNIKELVLSEQTVKDIIYFKYGNVLCGEAYNQIETCENFTTLCNNCFSFSIETRINPVITERDEERALKEFKRIGNVVQKGLSEYYDKPSVEIANYNYDDTYKVHMQFPKKESADKNIVGEKLVVYYQFRKRNSYYFLSNSKNSTNHNYPIGYITGWPKNLFADKLVNYVQFDIQRNKNMIKK